MRLIPTCLASLMLLAVPAGAQPGERTWLRYQRAAEVQLRDVAAFVRVTPEDRADVSVRIANSGPLRSPELRMAGSRLIIDGKLRRQIRSCEVRGADGLEVEIRRRGRVANAALPVIELRVPRDAVVAAGGAVRMRMGPAETARVRLEGCGDADIERVAGEADIAIAGAPDVRLYDAGSARVAVAGAGDVTLGVIRSGLTLSIAGSGDVVAARVDGPTSIAIQGAGDVTIRDGRATTLSVALAGAGDVTHNGVAERLDAAILGAGDVRVRRVEGEVTRRVLGGGDVIVGR
jgi:hypothetical protein